MLVTSRSNFTKGQASSNPLLFPLEDKSKKEVVEKDRHVIEGNKEDQPWELWLCH